jgi:hypothetical protein
MSVTLLLATEESDRQVVTSASEFVQTAAHRMDILHHPDMLLDRLADVPLIAGSVLTIVGLLCVFNGYRWHRWVVAILAFLCGLGMGKMLAERFGDSNIVAVALGGMCAIVATPLMKIAVAIFSGMTGAFIGANVWTALNAESADQHWAGAAMGFIALALASVILFRLMVVLFTSVGGAAMTVFGGIIVLLQVPEWEPAIRQSLLSHQLMIPLLVTLAAVGGFVLQEGRNRQEAAPSEDG